MKIIKIPCPFEGEGQCGDENIIEKPIWYKARLMTFGIKWRWKGKGFIAIDGVRLVNQIMSLRL
jgi:hypothetical protein